MLGSDEFVGFDAATWRAPMPARRGAVRCVRARGVGAGRRDADPRAGRAAVPRRRAGRAPGRRSAPSERAGRCGPGGARSLVAVVFGGALGPALLVAGLARIPAATASLLLNFELVATLAIAAVVFREHLGRRLVAAAALVGVAGVLLVWQPGVAFDVGGLFVIGACVCWGIDNSVTARIDQLSPEQITFAKGAVAGTVNLVLGLVIATRRHIEIRQVVAALVIGALGYGASITLWVKGARDLGAARGPGHLRRRPVHRRASCRGPCCTSRSRSSQLIAVPIAAAGVALSLRTSHEHAHRHEPLDHEHEHTHDDAHHDHVHPPEFVGRHTHRHRHDPIEHVHDHVPDLHHGHAH